MSGADLDVQLVIILRLLLAALLSALLGYDRESLGRPAGLRTHMLVCMSSCLLVSLGEVVLVAAGTVEGARVDPLRVLEAIVTGVSFIGAGTIFRAGGDVHGITTAGSLLGAASIGAVVGFELYTLAAAATGLLFVVLRVVRHLESLSHTAPSLDDDDGSDRPLDDVLSPRGRP